jgi:hypothetical protein
LAGRLPKTQKEPGCESGKDDINTTRDAAGGIDAFDGRKPGDYLLRGEASYAAVGFAGNLAAAGAGI